MASRNFLVVCESFYSIQGEGKTSGTPSVFLRLAGCNLQCGGFSYEDPDTGEHLGCDSKQLWRQGERCEFSDVLTTWRQQGWLQKLAAGAHLVVTGGEPLLQQAALVNFLQVLDVELAKPVFVEVETNATLMPLQRLWARVNQWNVSPKLVHSGETRDKAYCVDVLTAFAGCEAAVFKFVVASAIDVQEIVVHYLQRFGIAARRVWLMPEGGTQASIDAKKPWLVELCKQHLFRFSTRLQVDIWGEVVGV